MQLFMSHDDKKKKVSSPSVPTWVLEKGKSHTGICGCMSLFIKILTHNQQHCSSGSGWDNPLHVHILWSSVIEYRTTVQCTYALHERRGYFNERLFFLVGAFDLCSHICMNYHWVFRMTSAVIIASYITLQNSRRLWRKHLCVQL